MLAREVLIVRLGKTHIGGEVERVCMTWYVAGAAGIPILPPCASNIRILIVNNEVNILAVFLDIVRVDDAHDAST